MAKIIVIEDNAELRQLLVGKLGVLAMRSWKPAMVSMAWRRSRRKIPM
jgi:hypothetical protein